MAAKTFIVTLKDHVADVDISSVKESFSKLGGEITHEFSLIKGFTVKVPESGIATVKDEHADSIANIEEDQEVSTKE
ncbi:LADA_0E11540g1_1 [Lachancea dasiensis]|uniref:LADA_0E11540g1_1 n=1 Tax=Lachancea dasiensis TaxID=1072105 RepID=A0A1G4JEL4_9SACH|nr:LADA_0E11540g1_1 [Lachancea dasiensis]